MSERFVQDSVAERLNRKYYGRRPAHVATEAYTKLKRADVFLAFMRAPGRPYVVVVEAKSRTTIHQLKLKADDGKLRWVGRGLMLALLVVLLSVLGYQWYFNALNAVLLIGVFVVGSALLTRLVRRLELTRLQSAGVIEQLARYPANEHWIAVGEDTFAKPLEHAALREQCRKNRIGLIVVDRKGRLKLEEKPSPKHVFNNYLDRYGKEEAILKSITKNPDYGPTPSERRKTRRQLLNAALLLGLVIFLGTIAYEETVEPVVPDPFADAELPTDELPPPLTEDGLSDFDAEYVPEIPFERLAIACAGFHTDRRAFIVINDLLPKDEADRRVAELAAAGHPGARAVPTECLHSWPAPGVFAVWMGEFYRNKPAAKRALRELETSLGEAGAWTRDLRVVKVRPG